MSIIPVADRVREQTTTTGTGNVTLSGAVDSSYQSFLEGVGNTITYYCISSSSQWEVGIGAISGGTTLARTTVLKSSNSNNHVNFAAGTKDVFIPVPADVINDLLTNDDVATIITSDDESITVTPGNPVDLSLNVAHENTWTAAQTIETGEGGANVHQLIIKTPTTNDVLNQPLAIKVGTTNAIRASITPSASLEVRSSVLQFHDPNSGDTIGQIGYIGGAPAYLTANSPFLVNAHARVLGQIYLGISPTSNGSLGITLGNTLVEPSTQPADEVQVWASDFAPGDSRLYVWGEQSDPVIIGNASVIADTFVGDGSSLTALDADNISSGTLSVARGGTGEVTASAAINALVPTQTGNSGKFLSSNGSAVSWESATGGVTSVSNSDGSLTISPTTGNVVGSLNVAHANTWTAVQTIETGENGSQLIVKTPSPGDITYTPFYIKRGDTNAIFASIATSGTEAARFATLNFCDPATGVAQGSIGYLGGAPGKLIVTSPFAVNSHTQLFGNIMFGEATTDGYYVFCLENAFTNPTTQPANEVQVWAKDYAPGDSRLYVWGEIGNPVIIGNGSVRADTFVGDGSDLTNLDPANIASGAAAINISGNAANVTSTVAIANGGTGQTTAALAINALAPTQTGNSGKYLSTNGSVVSWESATGGVSSVSNSDGSLTISPTTGDVVGSLNVAHANTWTASQTFRPTSSATTGTTFKAVSSQASNILEIQDNSSNVLSTYSENGYWTTRKTSALADGELSTSEVALWFNDTAGNASLNWKGKNASGNVVSGSLTGGSENLYFGDGSDSDVTITSGTTTLARDMYYQNLTISGTGAIATAGYKVFVNQVLDITNAPANSFVHGASLNGTNAAGSTPGNQGTTATGQSVGGAGAAGGSGTSQTGTGNTPTAAAAVSPGNGGASGAGGAGGTGNAAGGSARAGTTPTSANPIRYFDFNLIRGATLLLGGAGAPGGSSGGGDGAASGAGGGGGAGGPVIFIAARTINRGGSTANLCINAQGGNGGTGGTWSSISVNRGAGGGGGGAGGGWLYLAYRSLLGSTGTNILCADGGNGGNGGNAVGGGTGVGGTGGTGGSTGRITVLNLGSGTATDTAPGTAGSSGNANTGATGGSGGGGATNRVSL